MAHYAGGSSHPRFTSMDAMANAPFDDALSRLHAIHQHHQQIHSQMHAQFHQQNLIQHPGYPPRPQHPPLHAPRNLAAIEAPHAPQISNQQFAAHARAHAMMNDMHEQVSMMHNMMVHQAETLINDMIGWSVNFPPLGQLSNSGSMHERHAMTGVPHLPPIHSRGHDYSYENLLRLDESVKKRGVTTADLAKLKRARHSARDNCKQCGICQDNFSVGTKIIVLPCAHAYCEGEILHWFEQNRTCPTCRRVIENVSAY